MTLLAPRGRAGVIFDLDGVLLDSEELHYRAYRDVLADFGVCISRAEYAEHFIAAGNGPEYAVERYGLPLTPAALRQAKAPRYRSLLETHAALMPHARATVERLAAHFVLAIATNSNRADVEWVLETFGLAHHFAVVIAREDYRAAKPAPDAYVAARAALGLPERACLVIEDSPRGVLAATAAGLRVVAVPNAFTSLCAFPQGTELVDSLARLTPEFVRARVHPG